MILQAKFDDLENEDYLQDYKAASQVMFRSLIRVRGLDDYH